MISWVEVRYSSMIVVVDASVYSSIRYNASVRARDMMYDDEQERYNSYSRMALTGTTPNTRTKKQLS